MAKNSNPKSRLRQGNNSLNLNLPDSASETKAQISKQGGFGLLISFAIGIPIVVLGIAGVLWWLLTTHTGASHAIANQTQHVTPQIEVTRINSERADVETQREAQLEARIRSIESNHRIAEEKQRSEAESLRSRLEQQSRAFAARQQSRPTVETVAASAVFTSEEFNRLRETVITRPEELGRMLLKKAHPSGSYISTEVPVITQSVDRRTATGTVKVKWSGLVLENTTTFQFRTQKEKLEHFGILQDSAVIRAEAPNIQSAKDELEKFLGL